MKCFELKRLQTDNTKKANETLCFVNLDLHILVYILNTKKLYINHMLSVLELQDFARTCATAQTRDLMFCFNEFNKC